jgi:hypothetical protein
MSKLIFGGDPEYFASYKKDNKDYVCPPVHFRKVFGIKPIVEDEKHPVFFNIDGIKIHEDGVAFEFAIKPQHSVKELHLGFMHGLDILKEFVNKFDLDVYTKPTINFDVEKYYDKSDDFLMCLLFGCDPDEDAFNYFQKQFIIDALNHKYRYGGGHLHLSGAKVFQDNPIDSIKAMAITVGNFVVGNSPYPKLEKQRTFNYGKPGKFRVQKYGSLFKDIPYTDIGIEYRTPSNTWTTNLEMSEGIEHWAYKALDILENGKANDLINTYSKITIDSILSANQESCLSILNSL